MDNIVSSGIIVNAPGLCIFYGGVFFYSTSWCGPCSSAKRLLTEKGFSYEEIDIEKNGMSRDDLFKITGGRTVPQIVIDEKTLGGYDDLLELESSGKIFS